MRGVLPAIAGACFRKWKADGTLGARHVDVRSESIS